jgi:hypothetical protein
MVSTAAIFLRLETIEFNQLESNKSQTSILVHQEMQDSRIDEFFCRLNEGKFFPFCIIASERRVCHKSVTHPFLCVFLYILVES